MTESHRPDPLLASTPDPTGYRRALSARDNPGGFSTKDNDASAGGGGAGHIARPGALRDAMDRAAHFLPPDRGLAIKTIVAFWSFYFLLATVRGYLMDFPGQLGMLERRVFATLGGMLLTGLIYLALRPAARATFTTKLIIAGTLCLPASAVYALVNHYVFYVYSPMDASWVEMDHEMMAKPLLYTLTDGAFSWYFFFAAWAALYVALSYARQLRLADARAAALSREAQDAQLRALRYQINPHFLFNTLNSLSSLVLAERNETAEKMLLNLSRFFRTTLSAEPTADVPLSEEIGLQRLYLEIEQIRFPERLKVEIDVPETLMRRKVPVLILQPIVENAVKYGVARARRPVTIRISAHEEAGRLHLRVKDDGDPVAPIDPGDDDAGSTGVGIANVCARLAARFGNRAGCLHGPEAGGGYTVHLYMPMLDPAKEP